MINYMQFNSSEMVERELYYLLTAVVVPRPIAWVSTVDANGLPNLAPHSYFSICSNHPPIVQFCSNAQMGSAKDSAANAIATGEFVVNSVTEEFISQMNITAADFPSEENEFTWAEVDSVASTIVRPPRVANVRIALECVVTDNLIVGDANMILGEVKMVHVDSSIWNDGRIDMKKLRPVGRLSGSGYVSFGEYIERKRPSWRGILEARDGADL